MMFGLKRCAAVGGWGKFDNEFRNLFLPHIMRTKKPRCGDGRGMNTYEGGEKYRVLVWKPKERDRLEDLGFYRRAVLIWIFEKLAGRV